MGERPFGWSWFTAYAHAKTVGGSFAAFLLSSAFGASEVSFVSHSLGARVVLEAIVQTVTSPTVAAMPGGKPRFAFDTAALTAAAVDDNALDDKAYIAATKALRRIVVLSSMKDNVLKVAFTLGSLAEQALWWDYDGDARALGRFGPAFAAGSAGAPKTEWYEIEPSRNQDHGDNFPVGWLPPPPAGGWTDKSLNVARFARAVFDGRAFSPDLPDWGIDHTSRFRPGWTPKF